MKWLALRLGLKREQEAGGIWERVVAQFVKLAFPPKINLDPTAKQIQDSQISKVGQDAVSDHDNCISRKQFGTSYSNAD